MAIKIEIGGMLGQFSKFFTGHAEGLLDAFCGERQDNYARQEGAAVDFNCGGGDDAVRRNLLE
jgi:hypothetical protein